MDFNKDPTPGPSVNCETMQNNPKKHYVQQVFHSGLFNTTSRQRSNSIGDIQRIPLAQNPPQNTSVHSENSPQHQIESEQTTHTLNIQSAMGTLGNSAEQETNNKIPWQKVPQYSQKRYRSPEQATTMHKLPKTNEARQQMFNRNRPNLNSAELIETSNRFSSLPTDEVEQDKQSTTASSGKPKRPSKPPPIILYGILELKKLTDCLSEVADHSEYTYKIITKDQLIISTPTTESYKKIISHIRNKGLIGHTFTRKEDRCKKIVIKNLHHTTPIEEIQKAVEETGNIVRGEIINVIRRGTKAPCNVFFVNLEPNENNKNINNLKYIYHQTVKVEEPWKSNTIVQCTRCQQYGHTKNNCMRPYRCVKCAGPHNTKDCTKDKNTPALCALCSGCHPANYKGCSVYGEILARKKHILHNQDNMVTNERTDTAVEKIQQPSTAEYKGLEQSTQQPPTTYPSGSGTGNTSYSDILKQKRYGTHENRPQYMLNNQEMTNIHNNEHSHSEWQAILMQTINKQTQQIELLIQQMGTLMNLITALLNNK